MQATGRDQLPERSAREDGAHRHVLVVAARQHRRQREGTHGQHAHRAHAAHGRNDGASQNGADRKTAAQRAEQHMDGVVQVVGHAGLVEDAGHEHEERDRDQRVVEGGALHMARQQVQRHRPPFEIAHHHRHAAEREGQWNAQEDQREQRSEQDDREEFDTH